jgi:hypothetical protein
MGYSSKWEKDFRQPEWNAIITTSCQLHSWQLSSSPLSPDKWMGIRQQEWDIRLKIESK